MRNEVRDLLFKIGTSATTLLPLRDLQVPAPDQTVLGYSKLLLRADGSRVVDGYQQLQWVWDVLGRDSLKVLLGAAGIAQGDTSKTVYISTDLRDGSQALPEFVTFSAIMYVPQLSGGDGVSVARSPYAYQSVKIIFNKLTEVL